MGARLSCWRAVLHDGGMTRPITIAAIVAIAAVALTVAARAADDKPLGPHSYIIFCGIVPGTCTWVGETQPEGRNRDRDPACKYPRRRRVRVSRKTFRRRRSWARKENRPR